MYTCTIHSRFDWFILSVDMDMDKDKSFDKRVFDPSVFTSIIYYGFHLNCICNLLQLYFSFWNRIKTDENLKQRNYLLLK